MANEASNQLYQAALTFSHFLNSAIILTLGHRGKAEKITITFDASDFHHLAGLHKLLDRPQIAKRSARKVFNEILAGKIGDNDIVTSNFYSVVKDRIEVLANFENVFNQRGAAFRFVKRNRRQVHTNIRWKYLLEFQTDTQHPGYLFLDEYRMQPNKYVAISEFRKENVDYGKGHIRLVVLQIKQFSEGKYSTLYTNPSFID